MKRTLARIMAAVKKGSTSIIELYDISAPLAEWVADHVNDSGYRELHRYLAADTNQLLADMGCGLNDLEVPMRQVLHYQVPMRQVLNASIW